MLDELFSQSRVACHHYASLEFVNYEQLLFVKTRNSETGHCEKFSCSQDCENFFLDNTLEHYS
eukprot:scaffold387_cov174-Ochromonas_danica.AAC.2